MERKDCSHPEYTVYRSAQYPDRIAELFCVGCGAKIHNPVIPQDQRSIYTTLHCTLKGSVEHFCTHRFLVVQEASSQVLCMSCGAVLSSTRLDDGSLVVSRQLEAQCGHCAHAQIGVDRASLHVECTHCSLVLGRAYQTDHELFVIIGFIVVPPLASSAV